MGWGALQPQAPSLLPHLRLFHPLPQAGPWSSGDHSPHCPYTQGVTTTSRPRCPQCPTGPKPLIKDPFTTPSSCQFKHAICFLPTPTILLIPLDGSFPTSISPAGSRSHTPKPQDQGPLSQLPLPSPPCLTYHRCLSSSPLQAASCSPHPSGCSAAGSSGTSTQWMPHPLVPSSADGPKARAPVQPSCRLHSLIDNIPLHTRSPPNSTHDQK